MEKRKHILQSLLPLLFLSGVPLIIFPDLFNFILEDYYFYTITLLLSGVAIILFLKQQQINIRLTIIDILIICFYLYFSINTLIHREQIHIIKTISFFTYGLVYILVRRSSQKEYTLQTFFTGLSFIGLIETVAGILQHHKIIPNIPSMLSFGGSFGNPAPHTIFLSCIVVGTVHSLLYYRNSRLIKIFQYLFIVLALYLIVTGKIRSSWIALFVGLIFVFAYKYRLLQKIKQIKPVYVLFLGIVLSVSIAFSGYFMFYMKKDSAIGRIFIWKNCIEVIKDYPLLGTGYGNFVYYYNIQQAETVRSGNITEQEYLQADDIKMAFNDYIQIYVELGSIGLFLILAIIILCTQTLIRYKGVYKEEAVVAIAIIYELLAAGISSYPLTILKTQLLLFICFGIISGFRPPLRNKYYTTSQLQKKIILIPIAGLILTVLYQQIYIYEWYTSINLFQKNNKDEAIENIINLNDVLFYNELFLYNLLSIYKIKNDYNKSIELENKLDLIFYNYNYYYLKGEYYKKIGNYIEAEEAYNKSLNIIPSRILPKYNLLICYIKLNDQELAFKTANSILYSPIKIYNRTVEDIQLFAKKYIDNPPFANYNHN